MIYHIADKQEWQLAKSTGFYAPRNFSIDGFIHCSTLEQVTKTADRFYSATDELLLLEIDPIKMANNLHFENLEGGEILFPHLYQTLPIQFIIRISTMKKDANGKFLFPSKWEEGI